MNEKTSPSVAPPLVRRAVIGLVWLRSSICARVPPQLAGESKKTVNTLTLHVPPQEKHRRAKDHNYHDDPDDTGQKILRHKIWLHILTHAGHRWWFHHLRRTLLLYRRIRAPVWLEMGPGERRGDGDRQRLVPRVLHPGAARSIRPLPRDVVGAYEESGPARRRTRPATEGCDARAPAARQPSAGGNLSEHRLERARARAASGV